MVQTQYGGLSRLGEACGCGTLKSKQNEYSWDKRVSRKRFGCDCVRRAAGRGGGRRAIQSGEICRGISCCGDSLLFERGRADASRRGSCCCAAESLCAAGHEAFLCDEDAVVRARANKGARKVYRNTRGIGCGV